MSLFFPQLPLVSFFLLHFSVIAISTSEIHEIPPSPSPSGRLTEWERLGRSMFRRTDAGGCRLHDSDDRQVLMINGTADDAFVATCYPEPGFNTSSYKFLFRSDNQRVLNDSADITWSHVIGSEVTNISVLVDFNRFPGKVSLTLEARRIRDESLFDSISVHFLAAGLVIYKKNTNEIVSGTGRSLTIESYKEIYENQHMDLEAFAQYLNGSDSKTAPGRSPSSSETCSVSDIRPAFYCSGQFLWDHDFCSITDGTWNGTSIVLKRGCDVGFATDYDSGNSNATGLHFALYLQENRAGECVMTFDWTRFALNTVFSEEEYSTFLKTEILGQPPAVVRRIEPSDPFSAEGGEQLHVEMFNTADVNITSFNVHKAKFLLVNGTHRIINGPKDFYETAIFLTEPGKGKNLPWTISGTRLSTTGNSSDLVAFVDQTGFLFSYDDEFLTLESITPSTVTEVGGEDIVLGGIFGSFSSNSEHHNVLLGNVIIDKHYFISSSSREIRFRAPPITSIGLERLLQVKVQVEHSFSNTLNFSYSFSNLNLRGYAFGASYDQDERTHILSSCGNTTFMVTADNHDDSVASYKWHVFDKATFDNSTMSLLNETSASYPYDGINALELPNSIFPEYGVVYSVMVEVNVGNLSSSYKFIAQKSRNIVAGVTLIQPGDRFKALPSVNLRIEAKVDIPECFKDPTNLIYEWEYQREGNDLNGTSILDSSKPAHLERFVFSHENTTGPPDGVISPIRLGREMMIPREYLWYGAHMIQLTVRDHNQPRFYGVAATTFSIFESPLVAQIGEGYTVKTISDSEPLHLSANASFDPDMLSRNQQAAEFTFKWQCLLSSFANLSKMRTCGEDLLPEDSQTEFTIPSSMLQENTNALQDDEGKLYIQYGLTVRKGQRVGEASQDLIVIKTNGKQMVQSERVEIHNSNGDPVDTTRVKFWEGIIIQPVARAGISWSFRLDLPYEESATFLIGNENIISSSGYYAIFGRSAPHFERSPLGILADKLSSNQMYQFTITFQQDGMLSEEISIRLKTVELPRLLFPPLGRSSGTAETVFRASATTSFNGNGTFVYQFYLMEVGKPGSEYCVDGCSGANVVRFTVGKAGHYRLQCRLLSADGKKVLVIKNNPKTVVISASSSTLAFEEIEGLIWKDYFLGDDGAVNQKTFFLAEAMYDLGSSALSAPGRDQTEICANVTSLWSGLARGFVQRDLPNTPRTRNYVRIANSCARLGCFEREETLYDLLRLVDTALTRIPSEEALSISTYEEDSDTPELNLSHDIVTFYNLTMSFAISAFAGGSSRDRLIASQGEVSNVILDLGEMWTRHVTVTATYGQVCGWEATYTSHISERVSSSVVVASKTVAPVGISTMRVAVRCTMEQGMSLKTPFASFDWCAAVYDLTGNEKKFVTLAETFDYPFFSRVQGENKTDSSRLVSVDISTLGTGNRLVSALSESMVAAQARENNEEANSCYRIGMAMKTSGNVRSDRGTYNIPFVMRPRKAFGKILTRPFDGGYYGRRTEGISVTPETRNSSEFVLARSNTMGLYGVEKSDNRSTLDKLNDTLEGTGFELVGILIGIIVLILIIAVCVCVVISFILSRRVPPVVETTEVYVDRDFYGRRDVRLQIGSTDSASVTTAGASATSASSGRDHLRVFDEEDLLGTSIQGQAGETAPR